MAEEKKIKRRYGTRERKVVHFTMETEILEKLDSLIVIPSRMSRAKVITKMI